MSTDVRLQSMESVPRPPTLSDIVIPSASSGDESHLSDDAPVKVLSWCTYDVARVLMLYLVRPPSAASGACEALRRLGVPTPSSRRPTSTSTEREDYKAFS